MGKVILSKTNMEIRFGATLAVESILLNGSDETANTTDLPRFIILFYGPSYVY